jgi:hypothetical protein
MTDLSILKSSHSKESMKNGPPGVNVLSKATYYDFKVIIGKVKILRTNEDNDIESEEEKKFCD